MNYYGSEPCFMVAAKIEPVENWNVVTLKVGYNRFKRKIFIRFQLAELQGESITGSYGNNCKYIYLESILTKGESKNTFLTNERKDKVISAKFEEVKEEIENKSGKYYDKLLEYIEKITPVEQ